MLGLRHRVGLFLLVEDGSCTKALDLVSSLGRLGGDGEVLYNNGSVRVFVTADGGLCTFHSKDSVGGIVLYDLEGYTIGNGLWRGCCCCVRRGEGDGELS